MTPIDFIGKYAKLDDKIIDGENEYIVLHLYEKVPFCVHKIGSTFRWDYLGEHEWTAPVIYRRSHNGINVPSRSLHELWEPVARYVAPKEEEEVETIPYIGERISSVEPEYREADILEALSEIDKRLRALEADLKLNKGEPYATRIKTPHRLSEVHRKR